MREANSQTYNHVYTALSHDFNKYLYDYTKNVELNTKAFFKIKASNSVGNSSLSSELELLAAVPP
jgi:hypothetical protein